MAYRVPETVTQNNILALSGKIRSAGRSVRRKVLTRKLVLVLCSACFTLLTLLAILGAIFQFGDQEDIAVVEGIPVAGALASNFAARFFNGNQPVAVLLAVCAGVVYLVPFALAAVIAIMVGLLYHPSLPDFGQMEPTKQAKALIDELNAQYSQGSSLSDRSVARIVCNYVFTASVIGVLVYALLKLGEMSASVILGMAVVAVLIHLAFMALLGLSVLINRVFYLHSNKNVRLLSERVDAYWLSIDPEEENRREKARQQEQKKREAETANASGAIIQHDPFTWNVAYVRANESKCSDTAENMLSVSKEFLQEGNYESAAAGFDRVAFALDLLFRATGGTDYEPALYANQLAACKVYAFGLGQRDHAQFRLEQACKNARQCASRGGPHSAMAGRDLKVLTGMLEAFQSGESISSMRRDLGADFPYDILN